MNASSPQSESLEQTALEEGLPVCSILPILSDQGKCKICKCSQSPFNQFSFSILSLFLHLKTGLNYTRKDVDQKRILDPYFEQLFLPNAIAPVNYLFIDIYDNNAQIHKFTVHRPYKEWKRID